MRPDIEDIFDIHNGRIKYRNENTQTNRIRKYSSITIIIIHALLDTLAELDGFLPVYGWSQMTPSHKGIIFNDRCKEKKTWSISG